MRIRAAVLFAALIPCAATALDWTPVGPEGGTIVAFATAETEPLILAGTAQGKLFRMPDGETWSLVGRGLTGTDIRHIFISPRLAVRVWLLTEKGLFRSGDRGATFALRLASPVYDFAVSISNPDILYANTGKILKSSDGGLSWTATASIGLPLERLGRIIAVDQSDPLLLWTVARPNFNDVVYRSIDGGESWESSLPMPVTPYIALTDIFTGLQTKTAYASSAYERRVFRTTDASSWTPMPIPAGTIAFDRFVANRLYITSPDLGVYRSNDNGLSAQIVLAQRARTVAVDPLHPDTVYSGLANAGVVRTVNGGETWSVARSGLHASEIVSLAVDPQHDTVVYAGGFGALYKTTNRGATWQPVFTTTATISEVLVDPNHPDNVWLSYGRHVWRSSDGGGKWGLVGEFFLDRPGLGRANDFVSAIAVGLNGTIWIAGYGSYEPGAPGLLFKSVDDGVTFRNVEPQLGYGDFFFTLNVEGDPSIWIGGTHTYGNPLVLHSADGGETWTNVSPAGNGAVTALLVDGDRVIAALGRFGPFPARLMRSDDGGLTWKTSDVGMETAPGVITRLARDGSLLYAFGAAELFLPDASVKAGRGAVYLSADDGRTWRDVSGRLAGATISAASPDGRYAATLGLGVFVREDSPGRRRAAGR